VYPFKPRDKEIRSHAGGDLSRLQYQPSGQATWHVALRYFKQGCGSADISFADLLRIAKEDVRQNPQLAQLQGPKKQKGSAALSLESCDFLLGIG